MRSKLVSLPAPSTQAKPLQRPLSEAGNQEPR